MKIKFAFIAIALIAVASAFTTNKFKTTTYGFISKTVNSSSDWTVTVADEAVLNTNQVPFDCENPTADACTVDLTLPGTYSISGTYSELYTFHINPSTITLHGTQTFTY